MSHFKKDPQASLDYGFNYTDWLAVGETITTSTWASTPAGLTVGTNSIGTGITVVWLSGGTVGVTYSVTNHVTTTIGSIHREDDRTLEILIEER